MKKSIFLFLLINSSYYVLIAQENENIAAASDELQFLQKESNAILKEWQKAKIQENLLFQGSNQNLEQRITSSQGKAIINASKKIATTISEPVKKVITNITHSKTFISNLDTITNAEVEKISNQKISFNSLKSENPPSVFFTSPTITNNKTLNLLYTIQANRMHYELLWQKLNIKIKDLAAKAAAIKEIKTTE